MNHTTETIKELFSNSITNFKARDPNKFSLGYIATKTNLSKSFIERAANNKLGNVLDGTKLIALSKVVCEEDQVRDVAEFFASEFVSSQDSIMKDAIYAQFVRENERFVSQEFEKIFVEEDSYIAYCLCCNDEGATKDHIQKVLGDKGLIALGRLEARGMVLKEEDKYKALKDNFSYTFDYLPKFFKILAGQYKPSNVGKERNYAHVMTQNLSRNGIKQWQAEHRRHHEALRKIKEENPGSIDAFTVGFMDTFTTDDIDNPKTGSNMKSPTTTLMSLLAAFIILVGLIPTTLNADEIQDEAQFVKEMAIGFITNRGEVLNPKDIFKKKPNQIEGIKLEDGEIIIIKDEFGQKVIERVISGGGTDGGGG